jgi:hypothetical protein
VPESSRPADGVLVIGNAFDIEGVKNARARVAEKLQLYTATVTKISAVMQVKDLYEKQELDILEWIWPESKAVLTPKSRCDVAQSCQWFLESKEYKDWIGQGPPVLVCSGKRMHPFLKFLILAGAGKSHLVYLFRVAMI